MYSTIVSAYGKKHCHLRKPSLTTVLSAAPCTVLLLKRCWETGPTYNCNIKPLHGLWINLILEQFLITFLLSVREGNLLTTSLGYGGNFHKGRGHQNNRAIEHLLTGVPSHGHYKQRHPCHKAPQHVLQILWAVCVHTCYTKNKAMDWQEYTYLYKVTRNYCTQCCLNTVLEQLGQYITETVSVQSLTNSQALSETLASLQPQLARMPTFEWDFGKFSRYDDKQHWHLNMRHARKSTRTIKMVLLINFAWKNESVRSAESVLGYVLYYWCKQEWFSIYIIIYVA